MKRLFAPLAVLATAGSVFADYPATVLADSPLVYYRFEEAAGSTSLADSSGDGNDTADFSATIGTTALGEVGAIGSAALFNTDGSILTPLTLDPSVGDFSIEALVNPTAINPAGGVFISNMDGIGLGRSNLIADGTSVFRSFLGGAGVNTTVSIELGRWYHVLLTYDRSAADLGETTVRIYVDGNLVGTGLGIAEAADGGWVLGSHKSQASQFYVGLLDEVSIYDYRLDDPDGDGDEADSKVGGHYKAYVGDSDVLLSFDTDSEFLDGGQSATLSWSVSPALTALTIDDGTGPIDVLPDTADCVGSRLVAPAATTTYTLSGTSPVGTEDLEVTIKVDAPPSIDSFTASQSEVAKGGSVDLSWVITNAASAEIDNGVGAVDANFGTMSAVVEADTTFTLTATNPDGTDTAEVAVTVVVGADPSLIAHWRVGEAPGEVAGTTLVSETGVAFDGTFSGTPAFDTDDPAPVPTGSSASIVFDGLNSWVDILGWNGIGGTTSRTVAFWFKARASSPISTGRWFLGGPNSTTNRFDTRVSANGRNGTMRSEVSGSGRDSSLFIADDTWHHAAVVVVDDGSPNIGEALFYVDGVLDTAAVGGTTDINSGTTVNARIGASRTLGNRSLTGKMDDIRIYNRALSLEEIVDLIEGSPEPLRITSVGRNPDGSVTLEWNGQPNTFYSVDYSFDLAEGNWLELSDGLDSGETIDITNAPGADTIFYRVREEE